MDPSARPLQGATYPTSGVGRGDEDGDTGYRKQLVCLTVEELVAAIRWSSMKEGAEDAGFCVCVCVWIRKRFSYKT